MERCCAGEASEDIHIHAWAVSVDSGGIEPLSPTHSESQWLTAIVPFRWTDPPRSNGGYIAVPPSLSDLVDGWMAGSEWLHSHCMASGSGSGCTKRSGHCERDWRSRLHQQHHRRQHSSALHSHDMRAQTDTSTGWVLNRGPSRTDGVKILTTRRSKKKNRHDNHELDNKSIIVIGIVCQSLETIH